MAIYCVDCGLIALVDDHCRCVACGAKVTRDKLMKDLLETAEEMFEYCDSWHWKYGESWKAAIDAARVELERGKR